MAIFGFDMNKCLYSGLLALSFIFFLCHYSWANPTRYGDTGLLTQPTADTLNAGNICVGLWGAHEKLVDQNTTQLPFSITLGLGTFLEAYGSFPNLLLNDEESDSPRGYANVGFKMRIIGKRSSSFKISIDAQAQRKLSNDPVYDGLTDYLTRVIASYRKGPVGIHANVGKIKNDAPPGVTYEDQEVLGGGIDIYPTSRLRFIAEIESKTEKILGSEGYIESNFGFQYFLSPHLTLNVGAGVGLTDQSPDWTALVGFSACQGIGTYLKPVPKIILEEEKVEKKEEKPTKTLKIRTLTPLIPKVKKEEVSPVSQLEVPVVPNAEEIVIQPSEKLLLSTSDSFNALPVSPVAEFVKTPEVKPETKTFDEPVVAVVHRKFRLPEFTFGFNQSEISEEGKKAITAIIEQVKNENAVFLIRAEGHTDNVGSESYNQKLSLTRAISAATHIVSNTGFDPERMFVKGLGESAPISDNQTEKGRSDNRRVELLILLPK